MTSMGNRSIQGMSWTQKNSPEYYDSVGHQWWKEKEQ
jgi:hypothetical protein